jgi:selenocysteine-specific elongation factor
VKHFILGTAGHVDHGKSSLIKALTNVNTDRLPEEQERGLSIDLGFAPLLLEDPESPGESVHLGIVDVPGHHRFLRNMIAGVGGFDAALLVVDCCEGVKPQTEEHLKILELLQTRKGVIALSKSDKSDEDGIEIARWELEELLTGTFLEGAPIVATSAHTGAGLEELKTILLDLFRDLEERNRHGVARLPIDRAFSKVGFGDVVTGSLWSGRLEVGDDVEILPFGDLGKVRGLHVHGQATDVAYPGQRVAVNISGLTKDSLKRGQTLISPRGSFQCGQRFAVSVNLLGAEPKLLQRKFKATFFQGTSNHQISVNLVASKNDDLVVFGQLLFPEAVLLSRGDRFLLRDETDQRLIAGGSVLAQEEKPFRRSRSKDFLARYQALAGGGEVGRAVQYLAEKGGFVKEGALKKHQGLSDAEWAKQLSLLLESGRITRVGKDKLWNAQHLQSLSHRIVDLLGKLADAAPWKGGWKSQEIASLLQVKSGKDQGLDDVLELLVGRDILYRTGPFYAPSGHVPTLGGQSKKQADRVIELLGGDGFSPRNWDMCLADVAREDKKLKAKLEDYLFGTGRVIRLSEKLVSTPEVMERARRVLADAPEQGFTASEARQSLDTSRKFIIPILEWMDRQGWTVRVGDNRKMAPFELTEK